MTTKRYVSDIKLGKEMRNRVQTEARTLIDRFKFGLDSLEITKCECGDITHISCEGKEIFRYDGPCFTCDPLHPISIVCK